MLEFSPVGRFGVAVLVFATALSANGCHRKPHHDQAASAEPVARPLPYSDGPLPFNTPSLAEIQPLKAMPSAAELARFPMTDGPERTANLTLPVDWRQDPYKSRAWSMQLNAWQFMPPILQGYQASHDPALLRLGTDIALDWVRSYPAPRKAKNHFAWYDMAVSSRAAMLGYLVRASGQAGLLKPAERDALVTSAIAHGEWLAESSHYLRRHNHGLFTDAGLLMMCAQLDRLKECEGWRSLARERFLRTLGETVSASGVHLEHTTSYHFAILRLLENRLRSDDDAGTRRTLDLMREAAPWFVQPDGALPQLGDTHYADAPAWAAEAAAKLRGARFFEDAGYYAVKTETAQLLVTGSHNSRVHKHADDLSFVLSEDKRRVFIDSGFLSYNDSPAEDFLKSAPAHNVFLADDNYVAPKKLPQFSLRASGEADGWYGVAGDDTHIAAGLAHQRTWLYRPGNRLLIVDSFEGDEKPHSLSRYFHLAPDFKTSSSVRGVKFESGALVGWLSDGSSTAGEVKVIKGERAAPFAGITSEEEDKLLDAPVVQLTTPAPAHASMLLLSVVELGKDRAPGGYSVTRAGNDELAIVSRGQRLSVKRVGNQLTLHAEKTAP